ncbi:MAG TPA: tRNA lysidine(34) synthetase TilS [Acidimicrobiales bacterium]|nr:tRNA lysidine(34) synthetase TilS [Acidimicrobiales bacterium]
MKPPPADRAGLLARCTFPAAGSRLTCAVSGGADSLALLVLAADTGCEVTAVHVDHGLRVGSADEADVVRDAAAQFGASFRAERVAVDQGPNLEARARAARYAVLPDDVATGHTADDQAETVLLNLLRGSGLDGQAGMRPGPRHPILGLRRSETHVLCDAAGLTPVVDITNDDTAFRRNAVRHDLLPLLDRIAGRDVAALLARQSSLVRDDVDLLADLAAAIDVTDARAVAAAPAALARRAVRRWLRPHLGGYPPDAAAVERVLAVARNEARSCDVSEGVRVTRSAGRLGLQGR